VLLRKLNDDIDALVRGQYPIAIAVALNRGIALLKQGAPVDYIHPKEGSFPFAQSMSYVTNAPHPNAAKVFIDWFYSREGQSLYSKNDGNVSLRKDVPHDHLPPSVRYVEGSPFMMPTAEDQQESRPLELLALGKQIFEQGQ